jgi:hypothetical protein
MENKYFTPDIEELCIGYELEYKSYKQGNYKPHKIFDGSSIDVIFKDGISQNFVRVPYLTKEQIEAEGWKPYYMDGVYTKDDYILNFDFATGLNRLNIHKKPETGKNVTSHDMLFNSKCKCINDFKKIIKILEI